MRGLGDRYSKTALNGIEVPSLDPDKNAVQMDMLPTNLIDNIQVVKSFSPDLPGSFSGGYVNLVTKDFPDELSVRFSASMGFNEQASFNNNNIGSPRGGTDFLGIDDGTRDIPALAQGDVPDRFVDNDALDNVTRSFNKDLSFENRTPGPNMSYSFSVGNQIPVLGKSLGILASINYSKSNSFYENGFVGRYNVPSATASEELNPRFLLNDSKGTEEVLWGAMTSLTYRLAPKHTIGINIIRNQSGQSSARYLSGQWDDQELNDDNIYTTQTLRWLERSYSTGQLEGNHEIGKLIFNWTGAITYSEQLEQDLRFFTSDYVITNGDTVHSINTSSYPAPSRYYRDMNENNYDFKGDFTLPFKNWTGLDASAKVGGAYSMKDREFNERRFDFRGGNFDDVNGDIDAYYSDNNVDASGDGLFVEDATEIKNSYTGEQKIPAAYAMFDLPVTTRLRVITGARVEGTYIKIQSKDLTKEVGEVDEMDILPAFNASYNISDNTKVRVSTSQTIARPTFRELAPYAVFDFVGGYIVQGNPDLDRTRIQNFDFRLETYPNRGEYFAVSAFYKMFEEPIALAIEPRAANDEIKYVNLPNATVYGIELEAKKELDFISSSLKNFKIGANASIIYSESDIEPAELDVRKEIDPTVDDTRPMYGQSPYLINASTSYEQDSIGLSINLSYNVFGERLAIVSRGALPDVYEQPAPSLDLVIRKRLSDHFTLRAKAGNLLDSENKLTHTFRDEEYIFSKYNSGRNYSIGISYQL